ncbi:MAG: regulatory protein RecX [Lachnospiraceae bacterium]|nr:regulatory protein RecX [Lachnospiraceae bacterium]
MVVTDIEPLGSRKVKIYLDDEPAFVLYKGELHKYWISVGNEINPTVCNEINTVLLPKRAKLRLMKLLQKRPYTEAELRRKLDCGEYPDEAVNEAIAYVSSYGYLDDSAYASDYIETYIDRKSKRSIEMELIKRGISKIDIEAAWSRAEERGFSQNENAQIEALLKKKGYDSDKADMKEKQRIYAFLLRKGFLAENISHYI